ncbi:MAG TPA: diguanylate cyclase [Chitinispirillaceae bacterium]|nr:diguanylate cyclase [Chitinispirillaceae bacterium]
MPKKFFPGQNSKTTAALHSQAMYCAIQVSLTGVISILLLSLIPNPVTIVFSILSTMTIAIITGSRLQKKISSYLEAIEKGKLLSRRFQNIAKYFESILQDSSDIIFTIDTEGFIMKFNIGSQTRFGYSQEEIVGKPLSHLFVNSKDEHNILSTVLLSGKSVNEEIPMRTKEDNIILLNLSMSEMKNDKNQIIGLVVTAKDITEKKKLEMELVKKNEMLSKLAITDSLTGLYNSRHFHEQIKKEMSRLKRSPDRKLSVIMIDIDHFKVLNDTQGHQMGDQVLRSLGQIIRMCLRNDVDLPFRYGGDEFIILLPDTDKNQACVAAERIQKQFSLVMAGETSLSIGIAEALASEPEEALIRRTDDALYQSKKEGRARISLA